MSSLRISQHRNPVDAPKGGADRSRSEPGDDGSGFALALGAAAAAPNAGTVLLGGGGGDGSGAAPGSRKRQLADASGGFVAPNLFALGNLWVSQPAALDAADAISPATERADVSSLPTWSATDTTSSAQATMFGTATQPSSGASVATVGQAPDHVDGGAIATSLAGGAPVDGDEQVVAASAMPPSQIPVFSARIVGAARQGAPGGSVGAIVPSGSIGARVQADSARAGAPIDPIGWSVRTDSNHTTVPTDTADARDPIDPAPLPVTGTSDVVIASGLPKPPAAGGSPPVVGGAPLIAVAADLTPQHVMEPNGIASAGNFAALIVSTPSAAPISVTASAAGGDTPDAISGAASAIAGPSMAGPVVQTLPRLDAARLSPMSYGGTLAPLAPSAFAQSGSQSLVFGDDTTNARTHGGGMTLGLSPDGAAATLVQPAGGNAAGALAGAPGAGLTATVDATTAGGMSDQIAEHLVRLASDGSREMVLRLHPAELGDLTIRVAVTGRDVAAWFTSPQPQVQSAISAALGQLQVSLGDAGYNLSGAWVGGDASSAQQQTGDRSAAPPRATAAMRSRSLSTAAAALPSAGGLNIYV